MRGARFAERKLDVILHHFEESFDNATARAVPDMIGVDRQTSQLSELIVVIAIVQQHGTCTNNFSFFFQHDADDVVAIDSLLYPDAIKDLGERIVVPVIQPE